MTEEEAIAYVKTKAQTEEFPVVPDEEVATIVRMNVRASVWSPAAAYAIGSRVQPTTPNGHFYEAIAAGTSGSEEPDWNTREGSLTRDGDTLVWQECATDLDGNRYDLRSAIHEIWLFKAGIAANQFDVSIDNQKWNRSQIYDHCKEMARSFAPIE